MKYYFKISTFLVVGCIFLLVGCMTTKKNILRASKEEIMKSYLLGVHKTDGINKKEAILLAQSQIIFLGYEHDYNYAKIEILKEDKNEWVFKFYPIGKTLQESTNKPNFLVSVRKKEGEVTWKDEYRDE